MPGRTNRAAATASSITAAITREVAATANAVLTVSPYRGCGDKPPASVAAGGFFWGAVAGQPKHGRHERRCARYARRSLRAPLVPALVRGAPFRCVGQRPLPGLDDLRCACRAHLQVPRSWL